MVTYTNYYKDLRYLFVSGKRLGYESLVRIDTGLNPLRTWIWICLTCNKLVNTHTEHKYLWKRWQACLNPHFVCEEEEKAWWFHKHTLMLLGGHFWKRLEIFPLHWLAQRLVLNASYFPNVTEFCKLNKYPVARTVWILLCCKGSHILHKYV